MWMNPGDKLSVGQKTTSFCQVTVKIFVLVMAHVNLTLNCKCYVGEKRRTCLDWSRSVHFEPVLSDWAWVGPIVGADDAHHKVVTQMDGWMDGWLQVSSFSILSPASASPGAAGRCWPQARRRDCAPGQRLRSEAEIRGSDSQGRSAAAGQLRRP